MEVWRVGLIWCERRKLLMECLAAFTSKQTPVLSIIETLILRSGVNRGVNCIILQHFVSWQ